MITISAESFIQSPVCIYIRRSSDSERMRGIYRDHLLMVSLYETGGFDMPFAKNAPGYSTTRVIPAHPSTNARILLNPSSARPDPNARWPSPRSQIQWWKSLPEWLPTTPSQHQT